MSEFQHKSFKFIFGGVNLVNPIDLIPPVQYYLATNIRSYSEGIIQPRPGLTAINTVTGSAGIGVHSIKRLNDLIANDYSRILGSGTLLHLGKTSFSQVGSGFSGNPLSFVIVSPVRTPRPWLYIGDSTKIAKIKQGASATVNWGIAAPTKAPTINFGTPAYTTISDMESTSGWANGGTAGAVSNPSRVSTTIARIAYDSGSTGWASVEPTATTEINEGMFLIFGASETAIVDMVLPAIPTTTVASISYDSGSTGACAIQLTATVEKKHIRKGSLLTIGSENVVVTDVIFGSDGVPSIRVTSSGTLAAGNTVTGRPCARVYLAGTFAAAATLTSKMIQSTVTVGIGFVTLTAAVDASVANSRPIDMDDDEVHISIQFDDLSKLSEAKIFLDVDVATNDFTRNYYFKALSPNDFVTVTKDTATLIQQRITRLQKKLLKAIQRGNFEKAENLRNKIAQKQSQLDEINNTPIETQTTLGDNQWTELRFKTKELFRVGSDPSRTLKNITAIRVQVNCTASIILKIDAFWIGGTYGPDVGNIGAEYKYIYRYRNKETGITSAWSPPSRTGLNAHRQRISVVTTSSGDSQTDLVDTARKGGVIPFWKYIGATTNGGTFNDDHSDSDVDQAESIDLNGFQPFCITDLSKTGTCNVAGTTVDITAGDAANVNWARNSIIVIDNQVCTLFGPPLSTSKITINESIGSLSGVTFYLPAPLLTGQALSSIFGPIGYGETGIFIFAVGNPTNPGTLYWTNGNDPDLMRDINNLDVCSPSEPLIAGVVYNGKAFILSTERMFEIFPNFSSDSQFVTQEIPNSRGMLGSTQNTAICVGPKIWYRGKDGIYETTGGEPQNITDKDLYSLFPHDGQAGTTTNTYNPPDDTKAQNLEYYDGYIYYNYTDTSSNPITLVYNLSTKAWSFDSYSSVIPIISYGEEGSGIHSLLMGGKTSGGTGKLWQQTGTSDDGNAIASTIETFAFDAEQIRNKKIFGDSFFDADPNNTTLNILVEFDRDTATESLESSQTRTGTGRTKTPPLAIQSGDGKLAYNESLKITWSSTSATPKLYGYEYSYIIKPEDTTTRATDPNDLGTPHAKWVQGFRIHCNTFNTQKTFKVQSDTGTNGVWVDQQSFNITSNGQSVQAFSFDTPFITHLVRIVSSDTDAWEVFQVEYEFNIEPELVEEYETQQTSHGLQGYQHLGSLYITHLSTSNLSLVRTLDGVAQSSITIPHSNGLRLKSYVRIPAVKYKVCQYKITSSSGFRLYKNDCEARVKQWNSSGPYNIIQPFGDIHFDKGALI
jgi:hypothetical protein